MNGRGSVFPAVVGSDNDVVERYDCWALRVNRFDRFLHALRIAASFRAWAAPAQLVQALTEVFRVSRSGERSIGSRSRTLWLTRQSRSE
jgi:hypothetical protein